MNDFPRLIVESLIYARSRGYSFVDAWNEAIAAFPPADYDFGTRQTRRMEGVEPPLAFFKRHAHAAYEGWTASRYCQVDGCVHFEYGDGLCEAHYDDQVIAC